MFPGRPMLALLSPAKRLDATPRPDVADATQPAFLDDAEKLVGRLRRFSKPRIAALMDVSDRIAAENHARFRVWGRPLTPANATPAVLLFRGDVYQGLRADDLTAAELAFAQDHLRILSGLYGLLRPLDLVQPYRLEMGTTFPTGRPRTLYEFWGDRLATAVNQAAGSGGLVVNLASAEYARAVPLAAVAGRIVTPSFREGEGRGAKTIGLHAKRARGLMARFLIQNRLSDPTDLRRFDNLGYRFDPALSTDDAPVFTRLVA